MPETELYDPTTVEALIHRYPVPGASYADLSAAVQTLAAQGYSLTESATRLNISERRVCRMRSAPVAPYPDMAAEYSQSERRAKHLERVADSAMGLAVNMRDDTNLAHTQVANLSRQELIETAMVLACMVNPDDTVAEVLGWVRGEGLANVIPMTRKEA